MSLYQTRSFRLSSFLLLLSLFILNSCNDDENDTLKVSIDYGYDINTFSPLENDMYTLGDTIPISIDFRSHTGEIIHFIGVDIYSNKDNSIKLYSVSAHQHVPDSFSYIDDFVLKDSIKITNDSLWVFKALLWSHDLNPDTIIVQNKLHIK